MVLVALSRLKTSVAQIFDLYFYFDSLVYSLEAQFQTTLCYWFIASFFLPHRDSEQRLFRKIYNPDPVPFHVSTEVSSALF